MGVRVCTSVRVSDSMCVCVNVTGDKCVCKSALEREGVHVTEYECAGVHMGGEGVRVGEAWTPSLTPGAGSPPSSGTLAQDPRSPGTRPPPHSPSKRSEYLFRFLEHSLHSCLKS